MKKKSIITLFVIALVLLLSLTAFSACDKNKAYSVTVTNGTGGGEYAEGATVKITANAPETGKEFTSWTLDGVSVDDKTKAEITFTMPANAVTATANYGDKAYLFALENCTADKETAKFGEQVTFTADVFEDKRFVGWSVKGVDETGLDLTKSPLTITMPANDINVTAQLEQLYKITVAEGCTTDKVWAAAGEKVTVKQPTPPEGHLYTWKFEGVEISGTQISQPEVTFTMPENDVNITVVLGVVDFFVSIEGGTIEYGDQSFDDEAQVRYGDTVTITANAPATGKEFGRWEITGLDTSGLDLTNAELTFTMPASNVTATALYSYIDYKVTVVGGTAQIDADAEPTSEVFATYECPVSIEATVPIGQRFVKWTSDSADVVFASATSAETTFTMPAKAVTVTAVFESIDYTVSVTGGTAQVNGGVASASVKAHYGDRISITAEIPTGMKFKGWTLSGVTAVAARPTITFTMPAGNVTATANYEYINYTVTVNGGTADKATAHYGDTVTITANEPGTNKEFIGWNSPDDGVEFNNNTSIETTFIMPASNVTVNAVFGDINKYRVFVNYDSGGAASEGQTAYCGDPVTITAKDIEGRIFVRWEITGLDTEGLDLTRAELSFTMPANNVTANAIYEDLITLTFEGNIAQSEPLTYRKGASKTFRIELGDSQELCEYDISLTNKACTFKVYDSLGDEIEPIDNGDGSMRLYVNRQDIYTIRVTYEGASSSSQCTIKITASSPTV